MIVRIPSVLSPQQLADARQRLDAASWGDGRVTAGWQSSQAKLNLQLPHTDPAARELGDIILRALERNPLFISAPEEYDGGELIVDDSFAT